MSYIFGNEEHELILGDTFDRAENPAAFHSMTCDFKPPSFDVLNNATVEIGSGHKVNLTVPHLKGSVSESVVLSGYKRPVQRECVLIIDHNTGEFILEKISTNIQLSKTRDEDRNGNVVDVPDHNHNNHIRPLDSKCTELVCMHHGNVGCCETKHESRKTSKANSNKLTNSSYNFEHHISKDNDNGALYSINKQTRNFFQAKRTPQVSKDDLGGKKDIPVCHKSASPSTLERNKKNNELCCERKQIGTHTVTSETESPFGETIDYSEANCKSSKCLIKTEDICDGLEDDMLVKGTDLQITDDYVDNLLENYYEDQLLNNKIHLSRQTQMPEQNDTEFCTEPDELSSDSCQVIPAVHKFSRTVRISSKRKMKNKEKVSISSSKLVEFSKKIHCDIVKFLQEHQLSLKKRPSVSAKVTPEHLKRIDPLLYRNAALRSRVCESEMNSLLSHIYSKYSSHLVGFDNICGRVERGEDLTDFILSKYLKNCEYFSKKKHLKGTD